MTSDFSGKFVPNTYENLLQIGVNNSVQGTVPFTGTGDENTIVDARGRRVSGLVVDQALNTGGIYFKNSNNLYGFTEFGDTSIFLKKTGTNPFNRLIQFGGDGARIGLDNTIITSDGFVRAYVKDGIYIKRNSATDEGKLRSSDGQSLKKLIISAENDNELYDNINIISRRDENVISSGVQVLRNPSNASGTICYVCIWSRSGNVITCDVWIDHDEYGNTGVVNLPVYVNDFNDPQYESFTGLVGHGINFNPSAQYPSQAVEFKSISQFDTNGNPDPSWRRKYEVTDTGYDNYPAITAGITRGRFSYKLI